MDIKTLKGVGVQLEKKLNSLGIYRINDLIEYYPYKYNNYEIVDIRDVKEDVSCVIKATVVDEPKIAYIKRNLNRLTFKCLSGDIILNVTIFNRAFLKNSIRVSKEILLIGKYNPIKNSFVASDIKFEIIENKIEPVYHLVNGIKNSTIIKLVNEALNYYSDISIIPKEIEELYHFISRYDAIKRIHNPNNEEDIKKSSLRLKYEELFLYAVKINYLKTLRTKEIGIKRVITKEDTNNFCDALSFSLTPDQLKAIDDINNDLSNESRMNRLILGDVGSGKTIVAIYAMYINFLSGYQSAMMAPTEILAKQHFSSITKLLSQFQIKTGLLISSMKAKEKKEVLEKLRVGEIDVIIGTHALINEGVSFSNLGLVITDEQHRFGVNQRTLLTNKGNKVDVLYLSATPIPRTFALTIYGELDISMIKTKPKGRKDIITKTYNEKDIKEILYKVLEELKKGHQIYIVSPLIDSNDDNNLKSVIELKEKLNMAFGGKVPIGIMHGKLKDDEKDEIMNEFTNGKYKILISTTVVEVGIDVANATMMIIYNAERFGLATLHQLRGRVGRNEVQSYCYLISNYEKERLKVLEESNDGFYISEKDFQMRGHGDLFGIKQSGDIPFKIANLKEDYNIFLKANNDANVFIQNKDYLKNDYYLNLIDELKHIE